LSKASTELREIKFEWREIIFFDDTSFPARRRQYILLFFFHVSWVGSLSMCSANHISSWSYRDMQWCSATYKDCFSL